MHALRRNTNSVTMLTCVVLLCHLDNCSLTCADMLLHTLISYVLLLIYL